MPPPPPPPPLLLLLLLLLGGALAQGTEEASLDVVQTSPADNSVVGSGLQTISVRFAVHVQLATPEVLASLGPLALERVDQASQGLWQLDAASTPPVLISSDRLGVGVHDTLTVSLLAGSGLASPLAPGVMYRARLPAGLVVPGPSAEGAVGTSPLVEITFTVCDMCTRELAATGALEWSEVAQMSTIAPLMSSCDANMDGAVDLVAMDNGLKRLGWHRNEGDGVVSSVAEPLVYDVKQAIAFVTGSFASGSSACDVITTLKQDMGGTGLMLVASGDPPGTYNPIAHVILRGRTIHQLARGRLSGDGDDADDVVWADQAGHLFGVLLNPAGREDPGLWHPAFEQPYVRPNIVVADLDGDTLDDISVMNKAKATVMWFLNRGNGTSFLQQPVSSLAGGFNAELHLVGDIDGDGIVDVFVSRCQSGAGYNPCWAPQLPDGSWGARVTMPSGSNTNQVTSAAMIDWDGDGDQDFAVAYRIDGTIFLLENVDGRGQFAIVALSSLPATPAPVEYMLATDLYGVGIELLVVSIQYRGIYTLRPAPSKGQSWDGDRLTALSQSDVVSDFREPKRFAIADFALGDGLPDLVVAHADGVSVRINKGPPLHLGDPSAVPIPVSSAGADAQFVSLGAINANDVHLDLVVVTSTEVTVHLGDGLGSFGAGTARVTDVVTGLVSVHAAPMHAPSVPHADIVCNYGSRVDVFRNMDGSGLAWSAPVTILQTTTRVGGIALADVSGSGTVDLIYTIPLVNKLAWLSNVHGNVNASEYVETVLSTSSVSRVEQPDLADLLPSSIERDIVLLQGNSIEVFSRSSETAPRRLSALRTKFASAGSASDMRLARIGGSGQLDIVVALDNRVIFLRHSGLRGTLAVDSTMEVAFASNVAQMDVGDVDGDGDNDLIVMLSEQAQGPFVLPNLAAPYMKQATVYVDPQNGDDDVCVRHDLRRPVCRSIRVAMLVLGRLPCLATWGVLALEPGVHVLTESVVVKGRQQRGIQVAVSMLGTVELELRNSATLILAPWGTPGVRFVGGSLIIRGVISEVPALGPLLLIRGSSSKGGNVQFERPSGLWCSHAPLRACSARATLSNSMRDYEAYTAQASNAVRLSLRGRVAQHSGGCLMVQDSSWVKLRDISVEDCSSLERGGGLFMDSVDDALLLRVAFGNCTAREGGGAYISRVQDLTLDHVSFESSFAPVAGGGLMLEDVQRCTLDNGLFQSCTAGSGAGLYTNAATVLVNHKVRFVNNSADAFGGGAAIIRSVLYSPAGDLSLERCSAQSGGGGMFLQASKADFSAQASLRVVNCSAYSGGGLYLDVSTPIGMLGDSVFSHCSASGGSGGAMFLLGTAVSAANSRFEFCEADGGNGGAIECQGSSARANALLDMRNCTVRGNQAHSGGGVSSLHCEVRLFDSAVEANDALLGDGGGLRLEGARDTELRDCTLLSNSARRANGGGMALFLDRGASVNVRGSSSFLADNNAPLGLGGLAYWTPPDDVPDISVDQAPLPRLSDEIVLDAASHRAAGGAIFASRATRLVLVDVGALAVNQTSRARVVGELSLALLDWHGQRVVTDNATIVSLTGVDGKTVLFGSSWESQMSRGFLSLTASDLRIEASPGESHEVATSTSIAAWQVLLPTFTVRMAACNPGQWVEDGLRCLGCNPGTFSDTFNAAECAPCPAGTYMPLSGQSKCESASPGQYVALPGAVSFAACPAGTATDAPNSTSCLPCAIGKHQPDAGKGSCVPCTPGSSTSVRGAVSCEECPAGTYQRQSDRRCVPCRPGSYTNTSSQIRCVPCPPGESSDIDGAVSCVKCPEGRATNKNATGECAPCDVGHYAPVKGSLECLPCPAGSYSNNTGSGFCVPCEPGSFANRSGLAECQPCGLHEFSERAGATACLPCPFPKFALRNGSDVCSDCDAGRQYARFLRGRFIECEDCPAGVNCATGGALAARKGHWLDVDPETGRVSVYQCLSNDYCAEDGECTDNRLPAAENPLCGACVEGKHEWGNECVDCDDTRWGLIFALLLVSVLFVAAFHPLSQKTSGELRITAYFIQICLLVVGPENGVILHVLQIFNANFLATTGSTCLADFSVRTRLRLWFLGPLFTFGAWAIFASSSLLVVYLRARSNGASASPVQPATVRRSIGGRPVESLWSAKAHLRTLVALWLFSFNAVVTGLVEFFDCREVSWQGETITVMHAFPRVQCSGPDDGDWKSVRPGAAFMMTMQLGLIPVGLFTMVTVFRRTSLGMRFAHVFGVLTDRYRPTFFWWQLVALMRRVTLIFAAVFLDESGNGGENRNYAVLSLLNLVFLLVHLIIKPWEQRADNIADGVSLTLLTLITITLPLLDEPYSDTDQFLILFLTLVPIVAFVLWTVSAKARRLVNKLRSSRPLNKRRMTASSSSSLSSRGLAQATQMTYVVGGPRLDVDDMNL